MEIGIIIAYAVQYLRLGVVRGDIKDETSDCIRRCGNMRANRILFAIEEQGFELLIGSGSVLRGSTNNDEIRDRVYSYLVVRDEW